MIDLILAYVPDAEFLTFEEASNMAMELDKQAANELEFSCKEVMNGS